MQCKQVKNPQVMRWLHKQWGQKIKEMLLTFCRAECLWGSCGFWLCICWAIHPEGRGTVLTGLVHPLESADFAAEGSKPAMRRVPMILEAHSTDQAAMQPLCNGAVRDRGKGGDGRRCTELFGCALKLDADPQPVCKMFPLTRFSALHYCCCFEGPFKTHGIISESELEEIQTEWCLSCYEDGERN